VNWGLRRSWKRDRSLPLFFPPGHSQINQSRPEAAADRGRRRKDQQGKQTAAKGHAQPGDGSHERDPVNKVSQGSMERANQERCRAPGPGAGHRVAVKGKAEGGTKALQKTVFISTSMNPPTAAVSHRRNHVAPSPARTGVGDRRTQKTGLKKRIQFRGWASCWPQYSWTSKKTCAGQKATSCSLPRKPAVGQGFRGDGSAAEKKARRLRYDGVGGPSKPRLASSTRHRIASSSRKSFKTTHKLHHP